MEYRCKTVSLDKLSIGPIGVICSLCDRCASQDCSNPIQNVDVSILGIIARHKAYIRGDEPYFVVACEGFLT